VQISNIKITRPAHWRRGAEIRGSTESAGRSVFSFKRKLFRMNPTDQSILGMKPNPRTNKQNGF
jgi:hypothetical protein